MRKHKYPAPFDEEPSKMEMMRRLYSDPNAPLPPSPPLPVDIPVDKSSRRPAQSLYRDLFGDDPSVLATALDSNWASSEQRNLAAQILAGRKSFHRLSTHDTELLDGLARNFNEGGEIHGPEVRQADGERLRVPVGEEAREQDDEAVQSGPDEDLQPDVSPHAGAYGWLSGGEEGSE